MLTERLNIYEYEEVLTGKKQNFICSFKGSRKDNEIEVGNIWRYAITQLLKWTPVEADKYLTMDIVNMLCLDKTFCGIDFDPSYEFMGDFKFVLKYAFPDDIKYSLKEQAISEYEHVMKMGKWANSEENYRFPKKFFLNNDGIERALYLLNYVISLFLSDMSIEELYDFFADQRKATRWLNMKKLGVPLKYAFQDPLEYFHESLSWDNKEPFYYYNKKIEREYAKIEISDFDT